MDVIRTMTGIDELIAFVEKDGRGPVPIFIYAYADHGRGEVMPSLTTIILMTMSLHLFRYFEDT